MKEQKGEHPFGDTGQMILAVLFLSVWVADSFFLRKTTFLSTYLPLPFRLLILILALIMAVWLVRSAHFIVDHEHRPDHVVTTGAFWYVRHPLYLASMLFYFGLAASTVSLVSLTLLVGIFIFYNYIASYEEVLLEAKFGESYQKYKTETSKWVPKLGIKH